MSQAIDSFFVPAARAGNALSDVIGEHAEGRRIDALSVANDVRNQHGQLGVLVVLVTSPIPADRPTA